MPLRFHFEISFQPSSDNDPTEQRDSQLDAMVEHGDNYATAPEMHIGFRPLEDD